MQQKPELWIQRTEEWQIQWKSDNRVWRWRTNFLNRQNGLKIETIFNRARNKGVDKSHGLWYLTYRRSDKDKWLYMK